MKLRERQPLGVRRGPTLGGPSPSWRQTTWVRTWAPMLLVGLLTGLINFETPLANSNALAHGVQSARSAPPRPGVIVTVAGRVGQGLGTSLGQGPESVVVARSGRVYLDDGNYNVVRRLNPVTGIERPVVGNGSRGYAGDGGPAHSSALSTPQGLAVDAVGNLIIADTGNSRIRIVAAKTGTFYGISMTKGDIYTVAGNGIPVYSGDNGPATAAQVSSPQGVGVDAVGNLLVADSGNSRIRVVAAKTGTFYGISMTTGDIYTVAGNGTYGYSGDNGPATAAQVSSPQGVGVDAVGNLLVADSGNSRIRVVAAKTGTFYGISMTTGDIYTIVGNGSPGYSGEGGPATSAQLQVPVGVVVDTVGNLIIADTGNFRVRVVAGKAGTFYGISMTAGDIYTVAGNGFHGYSADGVAATSTELAFPRSVALDAHHNSSSPTHSITVSASCRSLPDISTDRR